MDDNAKQISSYQLDQEILDDDLWIQVINLENHRVIKRVKYLTRGARGIKMSVSEVASLPTCKYSERVAALRLPDADLAFLKGLRRRIKNRLASQNSRRRSMEHLRRLTRELRAVRARRADALGDRSQLLRERDCARLRCHTLRLHIVEVLRSRNDLTEVPSIDITSSESQPKDNPRKVTVSKTETPLLADCFKDTKIERDKTIFECCIDKIVQNSVNHMYKGNVNKKIFAKTVFISNKDNEGDYESDFKSIGEVEEGGVLNLSVKREKRRSHGRKQSAPRRITFVNDAVDNDEDVLDLKIKKEPQ